MREIEIKAKVSDNTALLSALQQQQVPLSEAVSQHDRVYGLPGVPGASENSEPWLRIRTETRGNDTTHYFTLKKSVTNQLDSIEHETVVADADELEQIILSLGFVPYSDLTKQRQKAHVGAIEICVDHIDGLGDFIEAELLTADDADYGAVIGQLWRLLETYGVTRADEVTDGYDVLLNKKLGKE